MPLVLRSNDGLRAAFAWGSLGLVVWVASGCQPSNAVDAGADAATADADTIADASMDASAGDAASTPPTLTDFAPHAQGVGGPVIITGTGLADALHVTFGGGPDAVITVRSPTSLTVIVAEGSATGDLTVVTSGGTLTRSGFTLAGAITCPGFSRTFVERYPWVDDTGIVPTGISGAGLMRDMVYVGIIDVPPGAPSSPGAAGRVSVAEYYDAPHRRWATISSSPCVWGVPGDGSTQYGTNPTFYFTIGPNTGGYIPMTAGSTYYVNIQMADPVSGTNQCGSGSCNLIAELFKPPGT